MKTRSIPIRYCTLSSIDFWHKQEWQSSGMSVNKENSKSEKNYVMKSFHCFASFFLLCIILSINRWALNLLIISKNLHMITNLWISDGKHHVLLIQFKCTVKCL